MRRIFLAALIKYNGSIIDSAAMNFAGPSTFEGKAEVSKKGAYEIIVYAFDPRTGNSGVDKKTVTVR